ncbi:MAG: aminoacyl-tRNA deacylase [Anaerolineae bacterium]|nr:aminoacyl-tRNA deacylase [Anaerolineae bacterium]
MARKLQSMRRLEARGIDYKVYEFPADDHYSAEQVAGFVGMPPEQVYKTLVIQPPGGGKPLLVMLAAGRTLDLKLLAAAAGEKKLQMVAHKDAERLTGLKVGGISALALMHKNWPVYIDRPALELDPDYILVSAGERGLQLGLSVKDLIEVTGARVVDVGRE